MAAVLYLPTLFTVVRVIPQPPAILNEITT